MPPLPEAIIRVLAPVAPLFSHRVWLHAQVLLLDAARARGRTGGRPPALTACELTAAKAMLADPTLTVADVARQLRVAPSTLYRHLPGGRSALRDGQA